MSGVASMTGLKAGIRRGVAGLVHAAGVPLARLRGRVVILAYHRVLSDRELAGEAVEPGMYVHVDAFERHLRFLRQRFSVLSLGDLIERWERGRLGGEGPYAAITFDDGWRDNYTYAFPLLRRYELPATIFLATGFVGTARRFWPDRAVLLARLGDGRSAGPVGRRVLALAGGEREPGERGSALVRALKGEPEATVEAWLESWRQELVVEWPADRVLLDWAEVREMSRYGVTFGSHSHEHRILPRCADTEIAEELAAPLRALDAGEAATVPVLAYPNGAYDARTIAAARQAGYRAALTMDFGTEPLEDPDQFRLHRIGVHHDVTYREDLFALRLSGLGRVGRP